MHGHVSKHVKVHRNPIGGTNKHGKHSIRQSEKGKRYAQSNPTIRDVSQVVTPKQGLMGVECNDITTNPLRESSVAKQRG